MRWPKGPPHLALNPHYFFCISLFLFLFGQVSGQGPPHLALSPPNVFFMFFLCFPFLDFNIKPCFPPKNGCFCLFFRVSLCFSLAFLLASPFFTSSFFVSLSLSLFSFLPSCFSFQFLVLAFCFRLVCFQFQDVLLFLVFCLFSCFVLNHHIRCVALLLVFLLFSVLLLWYVVIFLNVGYLSRTSLKKWKFRKPQNEKRRKNDILTRAVSTGVFTKSAFSFCVSLKLACFAENTIKIMVSAEKTKR